MFKIKNLIYGSLLLVIFTLSFFLFFYKKEAVLQCHANIRYSMNIEEQELSSNLMVELFVKAGYASISGEVLFGDKLFFVRRDMYFRKDPQSGASVLIKEIILPGDDIDSSLWNKFYAPRPYNTPFFYHFEKLTGNLYYIGLASSPYFICVG